MAINVTTTIGTTYGVVTLVSKQEKAFKEVPFSVQSLETPEKFSAIAERAFRNDQNHIFISAEIKGVSARRYVMASEKFTRLAHAVGEKESKLNLVTRTVSFYKADVYVAALCEDGAPTIDVHTYFPDVMPEDRLKKALSKSAEKDNAVFVQIKSLEECSALMGLTKDRFIQNADSSEEVTGNE